FRFQVCLGTAPEREEALKILTQRDPVGCVVDVITLSIIRHIKAESAVAEICGPVCTTQSVIDLLRFRVAEAEQWRGKEQGAIVWQDGELRLEKYNEEHWDRIIADRRIELNWAQESLRVVPAMPSTDLSDDSRQVANLFKGYATDPAVAAQGSQYLLLSDDMGFRNWGAQALHVEASWTQPVLMIARDRGLLSVADYSEAINTLALNKHVYVSLDAGSLFYQARKSDFQVTAELSRLLQAVGGPNADLLANPNVLAKFIDLCWADGTEPIKVLRIASEAFAALTDGRLQDQREIVGLIASRLQQKQPVMARHALEWLIGHSLGLPYFDELVAERKGLH
ncbi:MAG TPA: hypothetical protein VNO69_10725, partial [Methyloceanibacter sp.]|nr:hypothetical protein [Methyloceanibacter sp.]